MVLWMIATTAAYFVKGLCGFANTMVFTGILSFTDTNNVDISPVDLLMCYFANVFIVVRERKHIEWRVCLPMAGLMILGCIPGLFFLKNGGANIVKIGFGIVIAVLGAKMLWESIKPPKEKKDSKWSTAVIGILAGVMCGMYGVGALVSAYMARKSRDTSSFRGNICTAFLIEDTLRLVLYAVTGVITVEALKRAAILLPFILLGMFLGIKSVGKVKEQTAKRIVMVTLIVSGIVLVINNL